MNPYEIHDKNIAPRFQFIEHAGKEILFLNFNHAKREDCFALSAEFDRYVKTREADGNLRVLFDMESPHYDPIHLNQWKTRSANYEKYFHSSAMIHTGTIFKLFLKSLRVYVKMLGKSMNENRCRLFEDKATALDFLSKD